MKKIGFFNLGSGTDPTNIKKSKITMNKIGCDACGLYKNCISPKISLIGEGKKKILFISEFPGKYEDENNTVLNKQSRKMISNLLDEIDYSLEEDCWLIHAVRCISENYRNPSPNEIQLCRTKLLQTIEKLQPRIIIPMGAISLTSLIKHRISGRMATVKMNLFFGLRIPDQKLRAWVCSTYSPKWMTQQIDNYTEEIDPVLFRIFSRNIKTACKLSEKAFYIHNYENEIFTTTEAKTAIKWVRSVLKKGGPVAFDYETNALKPHMKLRKIVAASISNGLHGYAFPFFYENEDFLNIWYRLMRSKKCKKIAHKMDMENGWTKFKGIDKYIKYWEWDTCLGAHFLNNSKPTQQKFWVYCLLGIISYDDSVDKYLKPSKENKKILGCNALNNIDKADLEKILKYNAQDSHFCFKLYEHQKAKIQIMGKKFLDGYKFFLNGAEALSKIQNEGLFVDVKKLEMNEKKLTRLIDRSWNKIKNMPEFKKWRKGIFNPNSDPQLTEMLYTILKHKKPKKGGLVDEKQLKKINTDFTLALITYRKYGKMRDTYLSQFKREEVNGIIRPYFNLHIPTTFRSSSNSPNFQNMPARDENALKYVMSVIIPRLGNKIIEWDYKGVEVTVSCCYHKDPKMISYVKNKKNDMHRDTTADIVLREKNEVLSIERSIGKNKFVFPSFYGSGVPSIAPGLWETLPRETIKHLKEQGVKTYNDFYKHIENVFDIFWNKRFPVYRDWKRKIWKNYLKKGYVAYYTGFRYYGPAQFTQITNCQIQGSAFHILLWSLTHIYEEVRKNFNESFIIGQIHDAIVGDIKPKDEKAIDEIVKYWGTKKVREYWDWIILPLELEKESTDINGSWNTMQERGFI